MPRWPVEVKPRTRRKGVLTAEQEARGYLLVETGHTIELWRRDRCMGVFSSGATPISLREAAEQDWERRWANGKGASHNHTQSLDI